MRTLVAGVGSPILGDDGVGVRAARALRSRLAGRDDVEVVELGTAGLGLLDVIAGHDQLILLDAMVSGAPPGTVHELCEADIGQSVHLGSSHEADLPTTLALGRKMGADMPENVTIIAIEAAQLTRFDEELTPEVAAAVPEVLEKVEALLR